MAELDPNIPLNFLSGKYAKNTYEGQPLTDIATSYLAEVERQRKLKDLADEKARQEAIREAVGGAVKEGDTSLGSIGKSVAGLDPKLGLGLIEEQQRQDLERAISSERVAASLKNAQVRLTKAPSKIEMLKIISSDIKNVRAFIQKLISMYGEKSSKVKEYNTILGKLEKELTQASPDIKNVYGEGQPSFTEEFIYVPDPETPAPITPPPPLAPTNDENFSQIMKQEDIEKPLEPIQTMAPQTSVQITPVNTQVNEPTKEVPEENIYDILEKAEFKNGVITNASKILQSIEEWRSKNNISTTDPSYKSVVAALKAEEKSTASLEKENQYDEKVITSLDKDYKALYNSQSSLDDSVTAKRRTLNLNLRDETGAAIAANEFENMMASLLSPENYRRFKNAMLNVASQLRNSDPAALAAFAAGKLPLDKLPGYAKIIEEFLPFVNKDALRKYTTDKIPEQYMDYRNDKIRKAAANKEANKEANKNTIVE
jgi:hypothetical protein